MCLANLMTDSVTSALYSFCTSSKLRGGRGHFSAKSDEPGLVLCRNRGNVRSGSSATLRTSELRAGRLEDDHLRDGHGQLVTGRGVARGRHRSRRWNQIWRTPRHGPSCTPALCRLIFAPSESGLTPTHSTPTVIYGDRPLRRWRSAWVSVRGPWAFLD